jgi:hypothetical protein
LLLLLLLLLLLCLAVIVESTYGTQLHGPRETRERLFTETIARTVRAGGRVLLPIVAIGRAQVSCCAICRQAVGRWPDAAVTELSGDRWRWWIAWCGCLTLGMCCGLLYCQGGVSWGACWHLVSDWALGFVATQGGLVVCSNFVTHLV